MTRRVRELARGRLPGAALALLVALSGVHAAEPGTPILAGVDGTWPPGVDPEADGAVVGTIEIHAADVFDVTKEEENRALFRVINKLHVATRPHVIRQLLLFRSGEPYSRRLLEESERILRASSYVYDAHILPLRYHDGRVDVEVRTRDEWTLSAGIGFGRSGGTNTLRFGLQDSNLLGTGKDVTLRRTETVDRRSFLYRYRDPSLAGTRAQLQLNYSDNSDGFDRLIAIGRPFYSLDARWSAEGAAQEIDSTDTLYALGEIVDEFRHQRTYVDASAGFSRGLRNGRTERWGAGFAFDKHRFSTIAGTTGPLPGDRTLSYPYLRFEWIEDAYRKERNLDRIEYTEDVNFGSQLEAQVGWSSTDFGGDRNCAVFDVRFQSRMLTGRDVVALFANASGRWGGGPRNIETGVEARYYGRERGRARATLFALVRLEAAHELDGERQLLLGGDSGLRGYPLRFAVGDRSWLVTVEQRWYTKWHVLQLVHVGGAVFVDVGRAWFVGDGTAPEPGVLKDVGLGLRITSSRTSSSTVLHLDVAYPLDGGDEIDTVQFLANTRSRF